jgi:two-component system LytT family response regulator
MKTLIIDDEPIAREVLRRQIEEHFPWLPIVGEAANVPDALALINRLEPDLLLLDIQLRENETGFDLLTAIGKRRCQVIFVTGYNEYAIKAFRFSAIDYLLKPVTPDVLGPALERAKERFQQQTALPMLEGLTDLLKETRKAKPTITIVQRNAYVRIPIQRIVFLQAINHCVELMLENRERITTTRSLNDLQETLEDYDFIRTHQSFIVNKDYVLRLEKDGSAGVIVLHDQTRIAVSRLNLPYVKAQLSK